MRIRAVIFDMGDIFFDATRWRRALAEHLQQQGIDIDYPALCRRWEAKLVDVYVGRQAYWDAFGEFLGELGLAADAEADVLAFARRQAAEVEHRTLFDGVADTLAELKARGVKLAVLSDTESREPQVRRRLADLDIEHYFDAVVTSIDIQSVKPSPEAFAASLQRLDVTADEAFFVGHDADELAGAQRCGLTAIAFNHQADVTADREIERFSDLLTFVE